MIVTKTKGRSPAPLLLCNAQIITDIYDLQQYFSKETLE